jgi:hypothetical protein
LPIGHHRLYRIAKDDTVILTTSTFNVVQSTSYPAAPPPNWSVTMPEPISYEFRVAEYMKDGKIDKVALQVCMHTHDQYGNIKLHGTWQEVPRIQIQL